MYIFDTNPIYYVGELYLSNTKRYNDLLKSVLAQKTVIAYTPIAIMEIVSRIYDEPQEFVRLQKGIDFLLKANSTHLPDFEQLMSEIVTNKKTPKKQYDFWRDVMVTIQNAPDPISLQKGFDDFKTFTHRHVDVKYLAGFRSSYETNYLTDMKAILDLLNPKYEQRAKAGKNTKVSKSECSALKSFLSSKEWIKMLLDIVAHRGKTTIPVSVSDRKRIEDRISCYREGYETLMTKIFCDGYRPFGDRKNDYNDIHLLLYVDPMISTTKIVSSDTGLLAKIPNHNTWMINWDAFLQLHGV
jgi:hypothetical protein